ncbi:amidase [Natronospirillum operosum]|uniref:Amidase n=1 Tax=Natronospirillum operosum TaxID=2759953 RepID=A0A4Z0WBN8_9GAMM|nr:amidase [Natronospirillum operosum]TGG92092.1 amidase [Natronospirillum operosum]
MTLDSGFLDFDPTEVLPTGTGPLDGLTFAVKDVIDVAGHVTGLGNPTWRQTHGPAPAHAQAVSTLLAAGARLIGRTHTDELAYSLAGQNAHYGTPPNPALPGAIPGGSSSGSASVVAAKRVDFALGTDTGGSIRIPASYCGLYGLRPTHGVTPMQGVANLAPSFDTLGWFARAPDLLRSVGQLLLPSTPAPTLRRVRLLSEALDLVSPELAQDTRQACAETGLATQPPAMLGDLTPFFEAFRPLQAHEAWQCFGAWIEAHQPEFGPGVRERFAMAATIDPATAERARQAGLALRRQVLDILGDDGVLCLPTAAGAAPRADASPEEVERVRSRTLRLTAVAGVAGCPQVTLPWLRDARGPVGFSLIGPPGSDLALLELTVNIAS